MNKLEKATIISPENQNEDCAKFTIDDTTKPFVLSTILGEDKEYTFSCWMKSDADGSMDVAGKSFATSTTSWQKFELTFTAKKSDMEWLFKTVGTYYMYHAMLENGNIASDWTPNPTDIIESTETKIEQKADEIGMTVVKNDNVVASINASTEGIVIDADKVDLNGYVTFNGLSTSGKTEINGDNIITGIIKSSNYSYTSGNYSTSGMSIDLSNGKIISKNFGIDENGNTYINGQVNANTGKIGNLTINTDGSLLNGTVGQNNSYYISPTGSSSSYTIAGKSLSGWSLGIGSRFGVTNEGILYCSGAVITGYATSNDVAKLVVGDYTNYVTDPTFELDLYHTTGVMAISSAVYHTGSKSLKMSEGAENYEAFVLNDYKKFPVKSGDRIYVEWYGYRYGADKPARINLQTVDADNNNIQDDMDGYVDMPADAEDQTWIKYSYVGKANKDGFIAISMKESSSDTMSGAWYIDDVIVRRMDTGELIVDGAITANKIATDAIKSQNYSYESGNFSTAGTFFDLANGQIISQNFCIDSDGNAYITGQVNATSGIFKGTVKVESYSSILLINSDRSTPVMWQDANIMQICSKNDIAGSSSFSDPHTSYADDRIVLYGSYSSQYIGDPRVELTNIGITCVQNVRSTTVTSGFITNTIFSIGIDAASFDMPVKVRSVAPLVTETYACGLDENRWSTVYTKAINANGNVTMTAVYGSTQSYAVNMYIGSSGRLYRSTNTSSRTIKHDIKALQDDCINAHNLYDVDVVQAKYNEDILSKNDYRYMQDLPMFLIEDLYEKYPMAVDKVSDNVKEWSWNSQYLIPPMLKLIQEQNERINKLEQLLEK